MLPAGHHPGQDPMEENLSAREDLLVPVPQAKHVWTTENQMEMPVVTSQPEEAAAAAWGEEMEMNTLSDKPEKMCKIQLLAVPIKVGAKCHKKFMLGENLQSLCPNFACSTPAESYQSDSGTACPTASQIRNLHNRVMDTTPSQENQQSTPFSSTTKLPPAN